FEASLFIAARQYAYRRECAVADIIECRMIDQSRLHDEVLSQRLLRDTVDDVLPVERFALAVAITPHTGEIPSFGMMAAIALPGLHEEIGFGKYVGLALGKMYLALCRMEQHGDGEDFLHPTMVGEPDLVGHEIGPAWRLEEIISGGDCLMRR